LSTFTKNMFVHFPREKIEAKLIGNNLIGTVNLLKAKVYKD